MLCPHSSSPMNHFIVLLLSLAALMAASCDRIKNIGVDILQKTEMKVKAKSKDVVDKKSFLVLMLILLALNTTKNVFYTFYK